MRAVINANSELIRLAKLDMSSTTFAPPFYDLIIARYNVLVNAFFQIFFIFLASTFVGAFLMPRKSSGKIPAAHLIGRY